MFAKVCSGATLGLEAVPVTVEVDISSRSLPSFTIVGLPSKAVEESKERVRSAIKNIGASFPANRITVNLSPADIPKEGPCFDLPLAIGILKASGQINSELKDCIFYGEISLDGKVNGTGGVLSVSSMVKAEKYKSLFIPLANAREASLIEGVRVYPVKNLKDILLHFQGEKIIKEYSVCLEKENDRIEYDFDFSEVQGQESAKRACEIAVAGGHNIFLKGPPGAGKTMLARSLPSIFPLLSTLEKVELTKIYSISGLLGQDKIFSKRPFRHVHHTTSLIAITGGGKNPKPGEISLAHRGVLFLDELAEFPRNVIEGLRQPLEDGKITVARTFATVTYPARVMLVAASNPCPCGNYRVQGKECKCLVSEIVRYSRKISGPILDRIDIHVSMPLVDIDKLDKRKQEDSKSVKKRVEKARQLQFERYKNILPKTNSELTSRQVRENIRLNSECEAFLKRAGKSLGLSARGYYKTIKVSRTIADLEGDKDININHIAESLQYRKRDEDLV